MYGHGSTALYHARPHGFERNQQVRVVRPPAHAAYAMAGRKHNRARTPRQVDILEDLRSGHITVRLPNLTTEAAAIAGFGLSVPRIANPNK